MCINLFNCEMCIKIMSKIPDYETMLDLALSQIKHKTSDERFVIPDLQINLPKNKTIIRNFTEIAKKIRREPQHILKFFIKKFAARAEVLPTGEAQFYQQLNSLLMREAFSQYLKVYIVCHTCGKYDTTLEKQGDFYKLKCEACGAERLILK